jgi:hypothetical protein
MTVKEIARIGAPAISRQDARGAFLEYRRATGVERDPARRKEFEGLMRGYRAIARGQQVIDVHHTLQTAGVQADTLYPRLAIVRADAKRCVVTMRGDGSATFCDEAMRFPRRAWRHSVKLPVGTFPLYEARWVSGHRSRYRPGAILERTEWNDHATAIVPIVPPALAPYALGNYHVLWDAVWLPAPPKDPLLLKHLAGHLYAIVAQWDLTPLEQAVLRGRL